MEVFNKLSRKQLSAYLLTYIFLVSIFVYGYYLQIGNSTVLIVCVSFILLFTYIFYSSLFKNTFEIKIIDSKIFLRSWGSILLNTPKETTINFEDIEKIWLVGGIFMDLSFHILLKDKSVITINWNFFRSKEFGLLKEELKKALPEKFQ